MKITKHKLTQIIKEELSNVLQEIAPMAGGALYAMTAAQLADEIEAKKTGDPRSARLRGQPGMGSKYDPKRLVPPGDTGPQSVQTNYPNVHLRARSEGGHSIDQDDTIHATHPHLDIDHGEQYEDTFAGDYVVKLPDGTAVTVPIISGETTSSPSFKKRVRRYIMMAAEK